MIHSCFYLNLNNDYLSKNIVSLVNNILAKTLYNKRLDTGQAILFIMNK